MRNKWILLSAVVCLMLVCSCTEASLCEDGAHAAHQSNVRINYEWPDGTTPPDSMTIMAVRVVNHRKFGMIVSTENLRGHYFYNAPSNVTEWVDPDAVDPEPKPEPDPSVIGVVVDPEKPNNGGEDPNNNNKGEEEETDPTTSEEIVVDHFTLPAGTYNFFTMETDTSNVYYRNVVEYLNAAGTGLQYTEIGLEYKVLELDDEKLYVPGKNYQDYNQGFKYIRTECPAIYIDRKELLEIGQNADMNIQFQPKMLTQNLDIYFNIKKMTDETPFVVDSVIAEISGIPSRVSVFDGHLYLAKTRKMLFRTTLEDTNGNKIDDTTTNEELRVHGNINVLSILHSEHPANVSGPGIMQIAIYSHTEQMNDAGVVQKGPTRRVQGRLNLYQTLVDADLIEYSDDYQYATKRVDHAVLEIETTAVVTPNAIQGTSSQGGINDWTFCTDVSTDVNGEPLEL